MNGDKDIIIAGNGRETEVYTLTSRMLGRLGNTTIKLYSEVLDELSGRGTGYAAALVMDHGPYMSEMDGSEFFRQFRALEEELGYERTPMLAVTGADGGKMMMLTMFFKNHMDQKN